MANFIKCDICGRSPGSMSMEQFKVKKMSYSWHEKGWERIDVCTDCLYYLRSALKHRADEDKISEVRKLLCDDSIFVSDSEIASMLHLYDYDIGNIVRRLREKHKEETDEYY